MTKGFTLIDCLFYIALLTLLILVSHAATSALTTASERLHAHTQLLESSMFLEELLRNEAWASAEVMAETDTLSFLQENGSIVRIDFAEGTLRYSHAQTSLPLIDESIVVESFTPTRTVPSVLLVSLVLTYGRHAEPYSFAVPVYAK